MSAGNTARGTINKRAKVLVKTFCGNQFFLSPLALIPLINFSTVAPFFPLSTCESLLHGSVTFD